MFYLKLKNLEFHSPFPTFRVSFPPFPTSTEQGGVLIFFATGQGRGPKNSVLFMTPPWTWGWGGGSETLESKTCIWVLYNLIVDILHADTRICVAPWEKLTFSFWQLNLDHFVDLKIYNYSEKSKEKILNIAP